MTTEHLFDRRFYSKEVIDEIRREVERVDQLRRSKIDAFTAAQCILGAGDHARAD